MVFEPESATHLKPWLVRTLEPICDAEPGALADYILALLKHNVPENEMRQELAVQLDEFLEKECNSFVDTLFTVIRTKSYMPYNPVASSPPFPSKPLDNGIPIPLDGLLGPTPQERTRKRSNTDDERDGRPPAKGPRLNVDGQFSRYGNGGGDARMGPQSSGAWNRPQMDRYRDGGMNLAAMGMARFPGQLLAMGMNGMGPSMNGRRPQGYQPPDQKRGICRDYHNNGYCARGAMCKFSHGDDAVIPSQLFPGPGMPFIPMFPNNGNGLPFMQGAAYDPHEARMDMRPLGRQLQRAPLLPRMQQEDGNRVINASGELPVIQDLTPVSPPDIPASSEPLPHDDVEMSQSNTNQISPAASQMSAGYNPMTSDGNVYPPMDDQNSNMQMKGMRPPLLNRDQFRGGRGGPSGRGRGTFGGEVHNFRPEKRNDKTLVVEKIPDDKLSLESVNAWFKKFGTVTNVAIDAQNAKALVSFSNHDEAHAAWKSEDAVFGNRFVKVFWHRPMEGHGQVGQRMLAASAPLVANMAAKDASTSSPGSTNAESIPAPTATSSTLKSTSTITTSSTTPSKPAAASASGSANSTLATKDRMQKLEQAITEQKLLMAQLDTAPQEDKANIMAKLRKLGEEMNKLVPPPSTSGNGAATVASSTPKKVTPTAVGKKPAVDRVSEHERKERERLDKELEVHNGIAAADGGGSSQTGESTEELKARLEKLKAEAASLGLDSALPSSSSSYRGYRGRGRATRGGYYHRGAHVMRGGPPRASMTLDNRPRKLIVKGAPENSETALRDWFEATAQVESVERGPDGSRSYIVLFKTRGGAEQGLAKGTHIPLVGQVQLSFSEKAGMPLKRPAAVSSGGPTAMSKNGGDASPSGVGTTSSVGDAGRGRGSDASMMEPSHSPSHLHIQEEEVVASGWGTGGDDEDGMGLL